MVTVPLSFTSSVLIVVFPVLLYFAEAPRPAWWRVACNGHEYVLFWKIRQNSVCATNWPLPFSIVYRHTEKSTRLQNVAVTWTIFQIVYYGSRILERGGLCQLFVRSAVTPGAVFMMVMLGRETPITTSIGLNAVIWSAASQTAKQFTVATRAGIIGSRTVPIANRVEICVDSSPQNIGGFYFSILQSNMVVGAWENRK